MWFLVWNSVLVLYLEIIIPVNSVDISLSDICGNKLVGSCPKKISLKVIGGQSSCAEKVPWNVLVELKSGPQRLNDGGGVYPYCGGVLITSRHVVSAAHCFWTNENPFGSCPSQFLPFSASECARNDCPASCTRLGPKDVLLHLGVTKRTEIRPGTGKEVTKIVIHPGWDKRERLNDILTGHDIAILTMKREVDMYSRKTIPICLPDPTKDRYLIEKGRAADVTGFGAIISPLNGAKEHPVDVQTATVTISGSQNCRNWWSIKGNQICAAGTQQIETSAANLEIVADSCNGDSGGGLTASNFDGREVLLGIISFGEPECGRKGGKPGVYTNVLDHVGWIDNQISPRSTNNPSSSVDDSSNICVASNGKPCKFPFKFQNQIFSGCTREFDDKNDLWCSTKTDSNGVHITNQGEYGSCSPSCPLSSTSTSVPASPSWSSWSSCSASCGGGTQSRSDKLCRRNSAGCTRGQSRRCNKSPCPILTSTQGPQWTGWSQCSASCGGGIKRRKKVGTRIFERQDCNIQRCPVSNAENRPVSSSTSQGLSTTWLVSGTGAGTSVESFVTTSSGSICGKEISNYPTSYTSAMGGFLQGKVYVCGGNSGYDRNNKYRVHDDCYTTSSDNPRRWRKISNMPWKTTNAAYSVNGDKMYIFGGYQKPACGYRPQVQIFDARRQTWSMDGSTDPPEQLGAYQCAVSAGSLIFVIGGWYPKDAYPYLASCKEELPDDELTAVNQDFSNYQDRVQIYDTSNGQWYQGPKLTTRRRNHGCTLVDSGGKWGIMVAGGVNSRDNFLTSVEYLDLGESLNNIQLNRLRWTNLPDMNEARANKLVLVNDRNYVHVVGGELSSNSNIQSYDKNRSRWVTQSYRTQKKRSYTTFVSNIETASLQC